MSREVLELVKDMGWKEIETQLALQCAPLLTGIKISNILIIDRGNENRVSNILNKTCISSFILYQSSEKTTMLLYQKQGLIEYINTSMAKKMLGRLGYYTVSYKKLLQLLKRKYAIYMDTKEEFPHELGLVLGYPVEDVSGFIKHQGKHYLCSGYWKVYHDPERKLRLFAQYEKAKEEVVQLILRGMSIAEIIDIYHDQQNQMAV